MIYYLINMLYNSDFPVKRTEGFDYTRHGIKRNKELDDLIDKLCEKLELKNHTRIPICGHLSPSTYYTLDEVIKEVGAIKNERDQLREEIEDIKKQHQIEINKLRKEFNEKISGLKNEIFVLKEKLDLNPKWKKRSNSYYRWNPDIEKEERHKVPRNFDVTKIEIDEYIDEISFSYTYHDDEYRSIHGKEKKPIMNISLYEQLEEEQKIKDEKKRLCNLDIHNVKTWEDIEDYIISKGFSLKGKHNKKMGEFLLKNRGKTFAARDIQKYVKFNNRKTRRVYCLKYVDLGLMKEVKKMGSYKSNL